MKKLSLLLLLLLFGCNDVQKTEDTSDMDKIIWSDDFEGYLDNSELFGYGRQRLGH